LTLTGSIEHPVWKRKKVGGRGKAGCPKKGEEGFKGRGGSSSQVNVEGSVVLFAARPRLKDELTGQSNVSTVIPGGRKEGTSEAFLRYIKGGTKGRFRSGKKTIGTHEIGGGLLFWEGLKGQYEGERIVITARVVRTRYKRG